MSKFNILLVNASLTDGGSERAMTLVAHALVDRGHAVTMQLVRDKPSTYQVDPRIHLIPAKKSTANKASKMLQRIRFIRKTVRAGNYDYIISYMWDLNVTTLIATIGLHKKVIVSERAFPGSSSRSKISRILEKLFYPLAHKIIYQTEFARTFCPTKIKHKSVVVPNIILPNTTELRSSIRDKRIVSMGRLAPQKNFPLLLRAFANFRRKHPDWSLEIYGRGPLLRDLTELVSELNLNESVTFMGYVPDPSRSIQQAGMFVLASDFEGISNAMTEAMSLGIPTVCTDCPVGGAALMITNRESGMLVPVGDEKALTQAMHEVADSSALAEQLSQGGIKSVQRFTPSNMAEIWESQVLQ